MKLKKNYFEQDDYEHDNFEHLSTNTQGDLKQRIVMNMDDIAMLQDEELLVRLEQMHNERTNALKTKRQTREFEEEICYLRRELQIRHDRRKEHEDYLKQEELSYRMSQASENYLPSADLDNSKFMFIN